MNRLPCVCPKILPFLDTLLDSDSVEDAEEVDEIDPDELVRDEPKSHKEIWNEIYDKSSNDKKKAAEHAESKMQRCDVPKST